MFEESPIGSQDVVEKPKPPAVKKRTVLDSIRETLIEHLGYTGKEEDFDKSDVYLKCMRELSPKSRTSKLKKSDGTWAYLMHNNKPVYIKWQQGELFFNQKSDWNGSDKKCRVCWLSQKDKNNGFCRTHSNKLQEVLLIRDTQSNTPVYAVLLPPFKVSKYYDESINKFLMGIKSVEGNVLISKYMKNNNAKFSIAKHWSVPTTEACQKFNTISIALFLLFKFHNSTAEENKIKLLMGWVTYKGKSGEEVIWDEVLQILKDNNIVFSSQPLDSLLDRTRSPLLPSNFNSKLPHTYEGHNQKGGLYDGVMFSKRKKHGRKGSVQHYLTIKTGLRDCDKRTIENIFQCQLTEKEDAIMRTVEFEKEEVEGEEEDEEEVEGEEEDEEEVEGEEEEVEGDEKSEIWKKMKSKAEQVEMMAQMATCIATMLKMTNNSHPICPLTKKLYNWDGFDMQIFEISLKTLKGDSGTEEESEDKWRTCRVHLGDSYF
ncbi:uncharacterized protein LOC110851295 [Folsomia candida]|uniref:uncharacterized protein LOC110851295 n=1 Tax=Folsomia candida TaxID=158441 RepID=UPI0016051C53|nr:uncharacterized protein LOC110851295 [Folsomia candida]